VSTPRNANERNGRVRSQGKREEFLLRMYDQMFNDINRHIMVVWHSVGVLMGAFAVLALVEKRIIAIDVGIALIVLISSWLVAHTYDSAYWYNRNLVIIANIERLFLERDDLRRVHYYFGRHRKTGAMLSHLRIQFVLGVGVAGLVLLYHLLTYVVPEARAPCGQLSPQRCLPWVTLIACLILVLWLRGRRIKAYEEFLRNSPGIHVDTEGLEYGVGHPVHRQGAGERGSTAGTSNG
jgi:hypothetical protein